MRMFGKDMQDMSGDGRLCPKTHETTNGTVKKTASIDKPFKPINMVLRKKFAKKKPSEDGEIKVVDLLKPLSDSESPGVTLSLKDMAVSQDNSRSMNRVENSSPLPHDLLTALNESSNFKPDFGLPTETNNLANGEGVAEINDGSSISRLGHSQPDNDNRLITDMNMSLRQNEQLYELEDAQSLDTLNKQSLIAQEESEVVILNQVALCKQETRKDEMLMINSLSGTNEEDSLDVEKYPRKRVCSFKGCVADLFNKHSNLKCSPHNAKRKMVQKIGCYVGERKLHPSTRELKYDNYFLFPVTIPTRNKMPPIFLLIVFL
ncbi:uncharacterized protein [Ambystoma mexicanum]|uniref:uncharacterized protein n=1 Tax=Ambystoma mexicanum TaxID=8296 RepID=UPI0037E93403